jgi:ubiquinone/menaquinone biosynthesis C-methylase UbiE
VFSVLVPLAGCGARCGSETAPTPNALTSNVPTEATVQASADGETTTQPGYYLGRKIAPTMSHEGAPWLVRPERQAEEDTKAMLDQLRLEPGDVVCDIGAGNGYHSLLMAKRVAPGGRVLAVDIQTEMLELLETRATEQGVDNVEGVLGAPTDPKLADGSCDLVFLADVYHELDDPVAMLRHFRDALTDDGRVVLLEFRGEDPSVPIKPLHKMTKTQINKELGANGFELARAFDGLPWQHLMFFRVAADRP